MSRKRISDLPERTSPINTAQTVIELEQGELTAGTRSTKATLAQIATAIQTIIQGWFGSAAVEDVGTAIGDVVQLVDVDSSPGLPAVDGSQLTGLAAGDILYNSILYSKPVGQYFHMQSRRATTAWNSATPETFFPAIEVTGAAQTLDVANYIDYVPYLRSIAVEVYGTSTFSGSAAASVITLADNADNNALLAALAEDTLFHGGYTDWRTVTWDGTDYTITNVNAVARTITVTGTPTAGAGTATLYSYRIAGSTTTARLHKADGLVLATAGASGRVAGLRTRDYFQGFGFLGNTSEADGQNAYGLHGATINAGFGKNPAGTNTYKAYQTNAPNASFIGQATDAAWGAIRQSANTKDRSLGAYLYCHVGRYIAP